jgi:hypothetical protein
VKTTPEFLLTRFPSYLAQCLLSEVTGLHEFNGGGGTDALLRVFFLGSLPLCFLEQGWRSEKAQSGGVLSYVPASERASEASTKNTSGCGGSERKEDARLRPK